MSLYIGVMVSAQGFLAIRVTRFMMNGARRAGARKFDGSGDESRAVHAGIYCLWDKFAF